MRPFFAQYNIRFSPLTFLFSMVFFASPVPGKAHFIVPSFFKCDHDSTWRSAPIFSRLDEALEAKASGAPVLRLDLSREKLRSIPAELAQLSDLKQLSLNRTKIESLPLALHALEDLEYFSADGNQFTDFPAVIFDSIPLNIDTLNQLQTLNLWSNLIAFFPASLGDLPLLSTLDLTTNDMTEEEQFQLKTWVSESTSVLLSAPCRCEFDD